MRGLSKYSLLEVCGVAFEDMKEQGIFRFRGDGLYSVLKYSDEPAGEEAHVIWELFFALSKVGLELDALLVLRHGMHLFAPKQIPTVYDDDSVEPALEGSPLPRMSVHASTLVTPVTDPSVSGAPRPAVPPWWDELEYEAWKEMEGAPDNLPGGASP